jgi:hypothetical protein
VKLQAAVGILLALAPQGGPYDAATKHPWNELHRALFTWRPTMGKIPEGLESDPLFWPLGSAPWTFSEKLLPVLDQFDQAKGETLAKDPLKRAVLQHDLWMFLDGLEGLPLGSGRSLPPESEEARIEVRRRLTPLLQRVALTPDEIRALPDTYAAAVASKQYSAAFDPAEPERPFLPPDLWDPKGPWVLVGREDDAVTAEKHVKHFRGRSAFLVFASLPGGRKATIQYFQSLRALKKSTLETLPPAGTRLALVRRPFLLDAQGKPHLSPLIEEVQIRVALLKSPTGPAGLFEFHLNREDLFAGVAGGLQATGSKGESVMLSFHRLASKQTVRKSCLECHGSGAIPSSSLRVVEPDPNSNAQRVDGIAMRETTVERETEATLKWKQADKSWTLLRQFWPKE